MDDLREAVDDLRGDMARHQRMTGGEVTDTRNHAMAADLVQRIEREQADAKTSPSAAVVREREVEAAQGIERRAGRIDLGQTRQERRREFREGKHGAYVIDAAPADDTKVREASEAEAWFLTHAMPRVHLLLSKKETGPLGQPSWYQRVLAVMALRSRVPDLRLAGLHDEATNLERRFTFELMELLEASTATFGDWKADKSPLVMVG